MCCLRIATDALPSHLSLPSSGDLVPSPSQSNGGSGVVTSNTPLIADGAIGSTGAGGGGGGARAPVAPSPAAINNRLAEVASTGAQV